MAVEPGSVCGLCVLASRRMSDELQDESDDVMGCGSDAIFGYPLWIL